MNILLSKEFFPPHPKVGQPTGFREKILAGTKRHTCRCNYGYWKQRIATLQERQGILSLRQWSSKPYQKGSTQERILDVDASLIDVQQLVMSRTKETDSEIYTQGSDGVFANRESWHYRAEVEGRHVDVAELAKNDGLELEDFKAWFNPIFNVAGADTLIFAIVHFDTFRY